MLCLEMFGFLNDLLNILVFIAYCVNARFTIFVLFCGLSESSRWVCLLASKLRGLQLGAVSPTEVTLRG